MGESFFTASLAILLPEPVQRILGTVDLSDGVHVCMPFRNHQLSSDDDDDDDDDAGRLAVVVSPELAEVLERLLAED